MSKKAPQIQIQEIGGDQFPDLATAQAHALPLVSAHLQKIIHDLIERGVLVEINGKIIPNPQG